MLLYIDIFVISIWGYFADCFLKKIHISMKICFTGVEKPRKTKSHGNDLWATRLHEANGQNRNNSPTNIECSSMSTDSQNDILGHVRFKYKYIAFILFHYYYTILRLVCK